MLPGLLNEFKEKKVDVQKRLAKNFICFARVNGMGYLISGGDEIVSMLQTTNCSIVVTGGSSGDIDEGERIVRTIISGFGSLFDARDVHSTILKDSLSSFMKASLEDKDNARGLAVEFAILDFVGRLTLVYFTGDHHAFLDSETNEKVFIAGCYDPKYRKRVTSNISSLLLKIKKPDEKNMKQVQSELKKRLKIEHCGIIVVESTNNEKPNKSA